MIYKLLVNSTWVEESSSLMTLIKTFISTVSIGDKVEIWTRRSSKSKWYVADGCVWNERNLMTGVYPTLETMAAVIKKTSQKI